MNNCSVPKCDHKMDHPVSGVCHLHYMRKHRTGSYKVTRRAAGTGTITTNGYIAISKNGKKKQEHVLIVEKVLGRTLPPPIEVHHVNGNRSQNNNANLVVCPDRAYHKMLHVREAALEACGNANHRKCTFCKGHDDTKNMTHNKSSRYFYHAACKTADNKLRRIK